MESFLLGPFRVLESLVAKYYFTIVAKVTSTVRMHRICPLVTFQLLAWFVLAAFSKLDIIINYF